MTAALVLACAAAAACSSRRSEPLVGTQPPRTFSVTAGERVFMAHCHSCHPHGEGGLGPSLNDKPLPAFLVRLQIRRGLGAMPAFDERELSDADVEHAIAYLAALRGLRAPARTSRAKMDASARRLRRADAADAAAFAWRPPLGEAPSAR